MRIVNVAGHGWAGFRKIAIIAIADAPGVASPAWIPLVVGALAMQD